MVKDVLRTLRRLLQLLLLGIAVTGCAAPVLPPAETVPVKNVPVPEETRLPGTDDPRERASLGLTEQGRVLLIDGRVDEAIGLFERALNISPANGCNYFFLAEAWILKGDYYQAREWNGMAETYLREDETWIGKVLEQKKKIKQGMR
jgi:tetratricopeptide (TPR) repeat protein